MKKSPSDGKKILIITGEASGDQLGAALAVSLREIDPAVRLHGVGGSKMEALRLDSFRSSGTSHATGLTEVLKHLPEYFRLFQQILEDIRTIRPDLIVLVDNPGFNLRLAKKLLPSGIPVVGYVSPQVWAWKEGRTRTMAKVFKKVLTLFDFEEDFLEKRGVKAKWVGHPIVEAWPADPGRAPERDAAPAQRILLLPGSRPHEVRKLLPVMLEAAGRISKKYPDIRWSLLEADTLPDAFYAPLLAPAAGPRLERVRGGDKQKLFLKSDLAWACSGTVTLECALAQLPSIIGYRTSTITVVIARFLVKVKYLGMPNLLAGKEIMPELLQEKFTPENLESLTLNWLQNPSALALSRSSLSSIRPHLGAPGSAQRAAHELLSLI